MCVLLVYDDIVSLEKVQCLSQRRRLIFEIKKEFCCVIAETTQTRIQEGAQMVFRFPLRVCTDQDPGHKRRALRLTTMEFIQSARSVMLVKCRPFSMAPLFPLSASEQ